MSEMHFRVRYRRIVKASQQIDGGGYAVVSAPDWKTAVGSFLDQSKSDPAVEVMPTWVDLELGNRARAEEMQENAKLTNEQLALRAIMAIEALAERGVSLSELFPSIASALDSLPSDDELFLR